MLKVILLAIGLIALAVAGIAIKMFFKKDYQFEKKCSTVDPKTGERVSTCGCGSSGYCENSEGSHEKERLSGRKPDLDR